MYIKACIFYCPCNGSAAAYMLWKGGGASARAGLRREISAAYRIRMEAGRVNWVLSDFTSSRRIEILKETSSLYAPEVETDYSGKLYNYDVVSRVWYLKSLIVFHFPNSKYLSYFFFQTWLSRLYRWYGVTSVRFIYIHRVEYCSSLVD